MRFLSAKPKPSARTTCWSFIRAMETPLSSPRSMTPRADARREYEKAKKRYANAEALFDEYSDRLRRADLERSLRSSADVVTIIQRPSHED